MTIRHLFSARSQRRGFALIELPIALGVLSLLLVAAGSLLAGGVSWYVWPLAGLWPALLLFVVASLGDRTRRSREADDRQS